MHLFNFCLGEHDGTTMFDYISDNDASSKMVENNSHHTDHHSKHITVPVRRYDNLELGIQPDLIIMDVEGFEYEVLKGMKDLLSNLERCDIVIEIMPQTKTKNETMAIMASYGFTKHHRVDDHDCHFRKD